MTEITDPCVCSAEGPWPRMCEHRDTLMSAETAMVCRGCPLILQNGKEVPYDRAMYLETWAKKKRASQIASGEVEVDERELRIVKPCQYLGAKIGVTSCGCQGGRKEVEVFHCAIQGTCTVTVPAATGKVKHCKAQSGALHCDKYKADERYGIRTRDDNSLDMFAVKPIITVGMAVGRGEEYSAIWATYNNILFNHRDLCDKYDIQFLIVDCQHDTEVGQTTKEDIEAVKRFEKVRGKYIAYSGPSGTSQPRNAVFEHADAGIVIVVDPHVLLSRSCIESVAEYYLADPRSLDLLVGPIEWRNLSRSACQTNTWGGKDKKRSGVLGTWMRDSRADDPTAGEFEVFQQGLGFFACLKSAWPGFHPEFRGFGGCETYICEMIRRRGGRVLCNAKRNWSHRFKRPFKVGWSSSRVQTFTNYLIGFFELADHTRAVECLNEYQLLLKSTERRSGLNIAVQKSSRKPSSEQLAELQKLASLE